MLETIKIKIQEFVIKTLPVMRSLPFAIRVVIIGSILLVIPGYFIVRFVSQTLYTRSYTKAVSAAHPAFNDSKDPTVSAVTILPIGDASYAAYADITNENFELSADNVSYNFSFQTADGATARVSSGKTYLLPGQRTYIVLPRFTAPARITSGILTLGPIQWQKRFAIPKVALTALRPDPSASIDDDVYTVEAAVRNDSPYQLKRVDLILFVRDKAGKVITALTRQESTLNPDEVRKFPLTLPGLNAGLISRIDVVPQTDVLDPGNLLLLQRNGGSDLQRPNPGS